MGNIIRRTENRGNQEAEPQRSKSELEQRLILKQALVRPNRKRVIGGSQAEPEGEARAELIYENDHAVGVRVECVCGKTTEIYFEYGD